MKEFNKIVIRSIGVWVEVKKFFNGSDNTVDVHIGVEGRYVARNKKMVRLNGLVPNAFNEIV